MVHCISSSEPDLVELSHTTCGNDNKFERVDGMNNSGDSYISRKVRNETHLAYAESSTLVSDSKLVQNTLTAQDTRVTSENLEKWGQKYSAGTEQRCSSLFSDDEGKPLFILCFWFLKLFTKSNMPLFNVLLVAFRSSLKRFVNFKDYFLL